MSGLPDFAVSRRWCDESKHSAGLEPKHSFVVSSLLHIGHVVTVRSNFLTITNSDDSWCFVVLL